MEREVNWSKLSPRGQQLLRQIGTPLSLGYSQREIADFLGEPEAWVMARVRELREEIERVSTRSDDSPDT
jgi:DNA-binding Lrp family transcriptional regulator